MQANKLPAQKPLTLPTGYTASSQAERIYLGKLTTCYTGVLAQHAEHRVPTAVEAQRIALLVAVAESFPFKTRFLQVSPTVPDTLFEPVEGELSPYKWLCLLVATSTMHSSKLDLASAARKAERLLERAHES
jgi:hypothetical protein